MQCRFCPHNMHLAQVACIAAFANETRLEQSLLLLDSKSQTMPCTFTTGAAETLYLLSKQMSFEHAWLLGRGFACCPVEDTVLMLQSQVHESMYCVRSGSGFSA